MFIVNIIEAVGSMTSIYMIRSDSNTYISTISGSNINLSSDSGDIVAKEV